MAPARTPVGKFWRTLAAACAALLLVMSLPAFAHGEEPHDEQPEASETAGTEQAAHHGGEETTSPAEVSGGMSDPGVLPDPPPDASIGTLLTNLHPATVHFAIALFLVAGIVEGIAVLRPSPRLLAATDVMLVAGGAGAVIAALFGWIHTGLWLGGDATMQVHRWIGTGLAIIGAGLAVLGWKGPENRNLLRAVLVIVVIAVLLQGYLGGELGHGAGHLWASAH
ncbi:DUF2231 domain-containing protein [Aurantiacibacter poecillastricola]|uniref:DUF2231 domain-containing protein n=1 Tax=Aurantiacibacter poecillastricola TaxID=3064385 RepID=UPI00273FD03F|nr:DUF2231 domain-containing protein [Aurantiacibacter sp. 219JJ12-13]MDP5261780.1 hypothetical protein [Aurantiacibacter sp. 219JJ12-13]